MPKYEVELRGLLKEKEREKLESFLAKNGKLIKKYQRTQWCFEESWKNKLDLRIKNTNGDYIFSLKTGDPGKTDRKEISIPIPENKIDEAFVFLKLLGYKDGMKAQRNAVIYQYQDIEWAIVEVPNHSYYFEAEKLVTKKQDIDNAEAEIRKVCDKLELTIYSSKQTMDYIAKLDREANEKFIL